MLQTQDHSVLPVGSKSARATGKDRSSYFSVVVIKHMTRATWRRKSLFGLKFQRKKGPQGGELWQQTADKMVGKLRSSTIGTMEREQAGRGEGFTPSKPASSDRAPPTRPHLQNLPKQHHQLKKTKVFRYPNLWGHFSLNPPQRPCPKIK